MFEVCFNNFSQIFIFFIKKHNFKKIVITKKKDKKNFKNKILNRKLKKKYLTSF